MKNRIYAIMIISIIPKKSKASNFPIIFKNQHSALLIVNIFMKEKVSQFVKI